MNPEQTTTSADPTFWAAPELIDGGYRVFPVDGKAPTVEGGFYGATNDKSQVAEWIEEGRGHHDVAIPTGVFGGIVVIDADDKEADDKMVAKYGPPTYTTKRGGHWLFKHPRNGKVVSSKVAPGLDRKGDGGYVIVPPSKERKWTNGIPRVEGLPILPYEFWSKTKGPTPGERKISQERKDAAAAVIADHIRRIAPGPEGGRHDHLRHLCGVLLSRDVSLVDGEDILKDAWGKVGGDLSERLDSEIPNTLATTQAVIAEGRATGVPSMEKITPGLYEELAGVFGWIREAKASVNGRQIDDDPGRFNLTDLGNAERFVARNGEDVRYCYPWSKWLVWTGSRWERDDAGRVHRLAKETVRGIYGEAAAAEDEDRRKALAKHATRSEAADRIRAMLELAKSEVPVSPDELDADPWLLNVPNGTLNLRTGELRTHSRGDLITKIAGTKYDPDAPAPAWGAFLERVLPGDELRRFVRTAAGYSATGATSEQVMFINHGVGANGKSTFQEALSEALGDYSMRAPTEMLMVKRSGGVPNDVARLKGARFVSASETEQGRHLAESLVKDLTGTDTITARFMRAEFFDFEPTHKLWLSTNHKPLIRGTDLAIWRRIRLVPWAVTIPPPEQDKQLPSRLKDELPGVLSWIVRGCLDWQREGLAVPDEVRKATGAYRAEMDTLGDFLEDRCVVDPETSVAFNNLWKAYREWCLDTEEKGESKKQFGMSLTERGFVADKGSRGVRIRRGLRLKEDFEPDSGIRSATSVAQSDGYATHETSCKTTENHEGVAHGGSELHINTRGKVLREVNVETEPHAPHAPPELRERQRLTEEETRRVKELIGQGMAPKFARAEVLGKGST